MYEVRKKGKKTVDEIKDIIAEKFTQRNGRVACGIVYCFSQNDCVKVAAALHTKPRADKRFPKGLAAVPYHAGMGEEREYNQRQWSNGQVSIICATVAFGMGINKPDVRFVFHHSIPKSLEAYHQESGRAGRDGAKSFCYLYYSYGYAQKARSMLMDSAMKDNAPREVLDNNLGALNSLVSYCENVCECRRTLLLGHFNETFDSQKCGRMCDACVAKHEGAVFEVRDVTREALGAADVVSGIGGKGGSMTLIIDVLRGSKSMAIKSQRLDRARGYGACSAMKKSDVERLLRWMVVNNYLYEITTRTDNGGPYSSSVTTVKRNDANARELYEGRAKATLPFAVAAKTAANRYEATDAANKKADLAIKEAVAARSEKRKGGKGGKAAAGAAAAAGRASVGPALDTVEDLDAYCYGPTTGAAAEEPPPAQKEAVDDGKYNAIYEALDRLRENMAAARMSKFGNHVPKFQIARDGLLDILSEKPPESLAVLKAEIWNDASDSIFIRNNAEKVYECIRFALDMHNGVFDMPEDDENAAAAAIGASGGGGGGGNVSFGAYAFAGTQNGSGGGAATNVGDKRAGGSGGAPDGPQWQKPRRD